MDDHPDPLLNFFSEKEAEDPNILYTALNIPRTATPEDIRKAYRKLALKYHPDKHGSKSEAEKEKMGKEFQKIGFAYAVLSDEGRRKRYDSTGKAAENAFTDAEEMGWGAYFETLFQRVDRKLLDDDKAKYQGSQEELDDLAEAYTKAKGSLSLILANIPHSTHEDEPRLIALVETLISDGKLELTDLWTKTAKDQTAAKSRGKKAAKEAKEAEEIAKKLGVWDEFYGDGKKGKRNSGGEEKKGKGKAKDSGEDALAALILKRQRDREGGLDAMAEKYRKMEEDAREKKRAKKGGKGVEEQENEHPPVRPNGGPADKQDISDADFEALQAKMFGGKDKGSKGKKSRA